MTYWWIIAITTWALWLCVTAHVLRHRLRNREHQRIKPALNQYIRERQADHDIKHGHTKKFTTTEDFLNDLDDHD